MSIIVSAPVPLRPQTNKIANELSKFYMDKVDKTVETSQPRLSISRLKNFNLILVADFVSWKKILSKFDPDLFDYRGNFIVIITEQIDDSELAEILKDFWSNYIVNVNIVMQKSHGDSVSIYTYFPFGPDFSCENIRPQLMTTYERGKEFINFESKQFFPQKMRNFHGCSLSVATFYAPPFMILKSSAEDTVELLGIEGLLLKILAEKLNFTIEPRILKNRRWGSVSEDGISSGAVGLVINQEVNLTIGYFFVSSSHESKFMLSSFPYYSTNLVFGVTRSREMSSLEKLVFVFDFPTWFAIVMVFIMGITAIKIVLCQKLSVQQFVLGRNNNNPMMNYITVMFGYAINRPPGRNFAR